VSVESLFLVGGASCVSSYGGGGLASSLRPLCLSPTNPASGLFTLTAREATSPRPTAAQGHSGPSVLTLTGRGLHSGAFMGAWTPLGTQAGAETEAGALAKASV
jgi:hypothetical protein